MSDYDNEKITITLTGRAPVKVVKGEWPKIADAAWHDGQVRSQSNRRHYLNVRQHADGRTIVYGILESDYPSEPSQRAGIVLEPGGDIPQAIYVVAETLGFDRVFADTCIGDLPPEEI